MNNLETLLFVLLILLCIALLIAIQKVRYFKCRYEELNNVPFKFSAQEYKVDTLHFEKSFYPIKHVDEAAVKSYMKSYIVSELVNKLLSEGYVKIYSYLDLKFNQYRVGGEIKIVREK